MRDDESEDDSDKESEKESEEESRSSQENSQNDDYDLEESKNKNESNEDSSSEDDKGQQQQKKNSVNIMQIRGRRIVKARKQAKPNQIKNKSKSRNKSQNSSKNKNNLQNISKKSKVEVIQPKIQQKKKEEKSKNQKERPKSVNSKGKVEQLKKQPVKQQKQQKSISPYKQKKQIVQQKQENQYKRTKSQQSLNKQQSLKQSTIQKQLSLKSKGSTIQSAQKQRKRRNSDISMQSSNSENSRSLSEADQSNKKQNKKQQLSKQKSPPKIGQKRRKVSKISNSQQSTPMKRRLLSKGKYQRISPSKEQIKQQDKQSKSPKKKQPSSKQKIPKQQKQPKEKKQRVKKVKQHRPQKPKPFKLGRNNPFVQIQETNKQYQDESDNILRPLCCTRCSNRNVLRAAFTSNITLLQNCFDDKRHISGLVQYESCDKMMSPLEYILIRNDTPMLEFYLHPPIPDFIKNEFGKHVANNIYGFGAGGAVDNYNYLRQQYYNYKRVKDDNYLLDKVNTGMVSQMAYGTRVRKVQMGRGNRQGNNAFISDSINPHLDPIQYIASSYEYIFKNVLNKQELECETLENLAKLYPEAEELIRQRIFVAIRSGNCRIAGWLIKKVIELNNYGFNQFHIDALNTDYDISQFPPKINKASLTKKPITNLSITPLHCACVNPNISVLEKFLSLDPDLTVQDSELRRVLHYAAVNPNPEAVQMLQQNNAGNLNDFDSQKKTPLHIACYYGNSPLTASYILTQFPKYLNIRDKKGNTPLFYALKYGHLSTVQAILTNQQVKRAKNKGVGQDRVQPLGMAAQYGYLEMVKWLIEVQKCKVNGRDKYKRHALVMAIRGGYEDIASYLLGQGADWVVGDASGNTPLHYACAYGQMRVIDMLVEASRASVVGGDDEDESGKVKKGSKKKQIAGGDEDEEMEDEQQQQIQQEMNDEIEQIIEPHLQPPKNKPPPSSQALRPPTLDINSPNTWKVTPINIAMLKNHLGCVKVMLNLPSIDVNCKDDKGRTLLHLALIHLNYDSGDFISVLLEKGVNVNLQDLEGNTAMHYLARYSWSSSGEVSMDTQRKFLKEVTELILSPLAEPAVDLCIKNDAKQTPFALCLQNNNKTILEYLKNSISFNKDPELLFEFKDKICNKLFHQLIIDICKQDPPTSETINCLDQDGFTPFLAFLVSFMKQHQEMLNKINLRINYLLNLNLGNVDFIKMTNEDLFDEANNNYNFNNYHSALSFDIRAKLQKSLYDECILLPFFDFLSYLVIEAKASPHAKVSKRLRYRIEEIKAKQLILDLQSSIQNLPPIQKEEEKLKKREEILKDRKERRKKGIKFDIYGGAQQQHLNNLVHWQQQPDNEYVEDRDGKQVIREYGAHGMQNAVHLLVLNPYPPLVDYFINDLHLAYDEVDYDGRTPFNYLSYPPPDAQINVEYTLNYFTVLMSMNIRFDYPDVYSRTPLLNFYTRGKTNEDVYRKLIDLGANINQIDRSGMFVLKCALIRRDDKEIDKLVKEYGANINLIDNKKRNLLHHAINMSSATADATFELERQLITLGINYNSLDYLSRTPLHYAFVKIKSWSLNTAIDPIETVSSLYGAQNFKHHPLLMNQKDKWLKTPLHYAAQRGASVCTSYLLSRGAQAEEKDVYGNTALGVGLLNGHFHYCIILIEKGAEVKGMVFKERPGEMLKKWKKEERAEKRKGRLGVLEERKQKKHLQIWDDEQKNLGDYGYMWGDDEDDNTDSDDDGDDSKGDGDYDQDEIQQESMFNQQNPFQMNVYGQSRGRTKQTTRKSYGQNQGLLYISGKKVPASASTLFINPTPQLQYQQQQNPKQQLSPIEKQEGASMFKLAVRGVQQGLAYLILDHGFDYMLAMQDAMDENKFMLVLTLLFKTPDDNVVQQKNNKQQNLIHVLAMNAVQCSADILKRIYKELVTRGVSRNEKDMLGRTALHYAVIAGADAFVQVVLGGEDGVEEFDVNQQDVYGFTPLVLLLQGKKSSSLLPGIVLTFPQSSIYRVEPRSTLGLLLGHGADTNIVYNESSFQPLKTLYLKEELNGSKSKQQHSQSQDQSSQVDLQDQYCCTLTTNMIRQNLQSGCIFEVMSANIRSLIEFSPRTVISNPDSDNRDLIFYAVIENNFPLLQFLLSSNFSKESCAFNKSLVDRLGRTPLHYVMQPLVVGSYENVNILQYLMGEGGYERQQWVTDRDGNTALDLARKQRSGVMFKEMVRLMRSSVVQQIMEENGEDGVDDGRWPVPMIESRFEDDAEELIALARKKEKEREQKEEERVKVDETGQFTKSFQVYYEVDEADSKKKLFPWECYLTKVDLRNGIYGDYLFYRMQLLYDSNRDLFVVFTRWGRIGESGMNQRSPFNLIADAKDEYRKIFKQKTGGNSFEQVMLSDGLQFNRVAKKYTYLKVQYQDVHYQEYLQPFDLQKCPRSVLKEEVYSLFEEIANITMYQRAMTDSGVNQEVMPVSQLRKDQLKEAQVVLEKLAGVLYQEQELRKLGVQGMYQQFLDIQEQVFKLSSQYFELVPKTVYKNKIATPLRDLNQVKHEYDLLETLSSIEYAGKVLLGAVLRQREVNPVDYIFNAINVIVDPLNKQSDEFITLMKYIDNTRNDAGAYQYGNSPQLPEIEQIFSIQRRGEKTALQTKYSKVPNHFLLYHGSFLYNFLSLLGKGMKIAPKEAPATGYMFGKGLYFADMFDKSRAYSQRGYGNQDSFLMLLCEVVVGNPKKLHVSVNVEGLEAGFDSVKGMGRRGPDYRKTLVMNNGVKVPLGSVINYSQGNQEKLKLITLGHNEYVVYQEDQVRMRYLIQFKRK